MQIAVSDFSLRMLCRLVAIFRNITKRFTSLCGCGCVCGGGGRVGLGSDCVSPVHYSTVSSFRKRYGHEDKSNLLWIKQFALVFYLLFLKIKS